ncbi:MAG: Shikimate dehydrogenase, partial [Candidatus Peribacteria bacterium GW2011_GWB1_54_5]
FARAALTVLKEFNLEIYLSSRDQLIGSSLSKEFGVNFLEFSKKDSFSADILINATPVGMGGSDEMIITKDALNNFLVVVDAVVGETRLAKEAESIGLKIIRGGVLAINQAIEQFYLYTGVELPKELTEEAIIN